MEKTVFYDLKKFEYNNIKLSDVASWAVWDSRRGVPGTAFSWCRQKIGDTIYSVGHALASGLREQSHISWFVSVRVVRGKKMVSANRT